MAATSNSGSSNANELNVSISCPGLTGNSRYVQDMDALVEKADQTLKGIAKMFSQKVDTVVVRNNYALMQALEAKYDSDVLPDVEYYGLDFRMFLDDEAEVDDSGEVIVEGVRQDGEPTIGEIMAAETAASAEDFDLNDRDSRDNIDFSLDAISQERINRAKAKAEAKATERLYNDWFESVPDVQHTVFLHDGTRRGELARQEARGQNDWVKFPTACPGNLIDVSCNQTEDSIIDWERYLLETGDLEVSDLTDEQVERLQAMYDADDLEYMGFDPAEAEADPEPVEPSREATVEAEAQAVAGGAD